MATKVKNHLSQIDLEKRKKTIIITAITVACVLVLSAILTVVLVFMNQSKNSAFQIQALDLTTEDRYALNTYDYEQLDEVQTTLRADTMYVTERNITRIVPELVSDTYTIKTENPVYETSIEFTKYPSPTSGINQNDFREQAYEMATKMGLSLANEKDKKDALTKYFYYYKYMLMSQGYHLASDVSTMSANGTLTQENLKKHPAADTQYGAVEGTKNAVEKVITLDTTYRALHPTGLYLPAGEAVTVKVEGLKAGEKLSMVVAKNDTMGWSGNASTALAKAQISDAGGTFQNNYFKDADFITASEKFYNCYEWKTDEKTSALYLDNSLISSQWKRQNNRLPWLGTNFNFNENGTYTIGSPFGGIMHINISNCYSESTLTIRGAVETPHYILGVTTPEYFDTYLRNSPGVMSVVETENGQLIGASKYLRDTKTEDIDKLAMLWHSLFTVNESFTGGTYNRNNVVLFDEHVPAGAAVALGGMLYACPTGWFDRATDYEGLLRGGQWGILHEIGHGHGNSYGTAWGFCGNQEGEVRNNALIALSYLKFCDIGTTRDINGNISAEHGFVAHPYSNLKFSNNISPSLTDFNNYEYFQALSMYVNIMHSFGVDKFYELLYTYKTNASYIPKGVSGNKRSDFAYRCSLVYGMDFRSYFNTMYKAGITDEMFDEAQLNLLKNLPLYEPIANLYAGGIDGLKTGGDYKITYGSDVTMDLLGKTISSNPDFKIVEVKQPKYGKITYSNNGIAVYKFNKEYVGNTDQFNFLVKQKNGQTHTFHVYLRINYNSTSVAHYNAIESKNLNDSLEEVKEQTPIITSGNVSGVANYYNANAGTKEVKVSEFYYKAEKTGEHSFYLTADDQAKLYFGTDKNNLEEKLTVTQDNGNFNKAPHFEVELVKDKLYYFKIHNLNGGGLGYSFVGLKNNETGIISNLNAKNIFHPDFTLEQISKVTPYVFKPKFLVSKKDNVLSGTLSTSKSDWTVLQAPENVQDGRYYTEIQYNPDNPSEEIGRITTDKWTWLIDGQNNTMLHTIWRGAGIKPPTETNPDVFVIDTNKVQQFNYFTIHTRNSGDAKILKYDLQISSDNINYKTVSAGDALEYKNAVANLEFSPVTGRYWKLIVASTTGKNFTIIAELSTGILANASRVLPITSANLYTTKNWVNTKHVSSLPNGMMYTKSKNEKMVIKFVGTEISLFAKKDINFGSATVKLDGKIVGEINLSSATPKSKQLVFTKIGLSNKTHTLEIITNTSEVFNLNYIGIPFGASLINAPNIYLEKALIISLTVFIALFLVILTLVLCCVFMPSFRKKIFGNKVVEKWDNHYENNKQQKRKLKNDNNIKSEINSSDDKSSQTKSLKILPLETKSEFNKNLDTNEKQAISSNNKTNAKREIDNVSLSVAKKEFVKANALGGKKQPIKQNTITEKTNIVKPVKNEKLTTIQSKKESLPPINKTSNLKSKPVVASTSNKTKTQTTKDSLKSNLLKQNNIENKKANTTETKKSSQTQQTKVVAKPNIKANEPMQTKSTKIVAKPSNKVNEPMQTKSTKK